jgi:hypothetical protein
MLKAKPETTAMTAKVLVKRKPRKAAATWDKTEVANALRTVAVGCAAATLNSTQA